MCDVSRCKRPFLLTYAAFGGKRNKEVEVCQFHWDKHCKEGGKFDLRLHFKKKGKKK
jgi:hypothetical protein